MAHESRANGRLLSLVLLIATLFLLAQALSAQASPAAEQHVIHESWTFKDGAPGDVTCLEQTNDGFLWLGGPNGLFRFDGTRFESFKSPFGDRLLANDLYSLFAPPSGGLWIGYTLGGFSFLNNGRVTNYASETGSVYGFAQDRDGIVWAAASSGLWRFDHLGWQHIGSDWNAPAGRVPQVGFDSEGILWALSGGHDGPMDLIYLLPGARHFKTGKKNLSVQGFTLDADRAVITHAETPPMSDSGEGSDKKPAAYPVLAAKNTVQLVDRNNSIWISRADKPVLMRLPKETLHDLNNEASAGSSETYDVNFFELAKLVDREGNIWFGDTKGIHRFFYSPLSRQEFPKELLGDVDLDAAVAADDHGAVWISVARGGDDIKADLYYVLGGKAERHLPQVISSFAYRAPDKTFWFSGERCLWHLVGHDFVRVNLPREMAGQFGFLQAITQDQHGGIWVSFGRHGLYRWANGNWTPYGGRDDLPKTGYLLIEFTDSLGRVWFGYSKSQLALLDGDRVHVYGPSDGLRVGNITAIYGRGSEIWIGGEFGLQQFDRGRFRHIAAVNDEWLRGISGIVETSDGDLWLNAISGIFHIRRAEISRALKDSAYRVKGEHFGRREGVPGIAVQLRPLPTAVEGTDGRLWFTFHNGVVWLDPAAHSEKQTVAPPITIQSVSADDKNYATASRLSLPAHTSSVQISYSAVSLIDPEAIRFRYKLLETDKDWHEGATPTPVTYRNLPPGSYHFSVEASDTNGVWSEAPATAEFTILPVFYQTRWFFLLCMAATGFLVWFAYRWRVHILTGRLDMQFHERLGERTRIAQELHDTLLQGVLSASMQLNVANDQMPSDARFKPLVERVIQVMGQVVEDGRKAVRGLRVSTEGAQDLAQAFSRVSQELMVQGVDFRVVVDGVPRTLRPMVRDEVYWMGREALINAFRHARATSIEVVIEYGAHELRILVRDNGVGIDPDVLHSGREGHFGLSGMRERAETIGAKLKVWSAGTGGSEVGLRVPGRIAFESLGAGALSRFFSRIHPRKSASQAEVQYKKVGKS